MIKGMPGGREGAKARLALFWNKVAEAGSLMTFLLTPLRKPGLSIWGDASLLLSPYQINPMGMAPLRYVLDQVVDIPLLNAMQGSQLCVNAMNVHTGCSRVFMPPELSVDVLLASSCAPLVFQAVEIEGEAYWDGSYVANPQLWPLYREEPNCDIFMVELTPLHRPKTPTTAKNILNRINEAASINGLVSELKALDLVNHHVSGADVRLRSTLTGSPRCS